MAGSGRLCGLAGRVLLVLFVLSSCAGGADALFGDTASVAPVAGRSAPEAGPILVDTTGAPLTAEHATVVRSVYRALTAGDFAALGTLYAGDDWTGQAALLGQELVRRSVLDALQNPPNNLGEGYVYRHRDYQTAFFLDYDPPRTSDGPLRWRGITLPTPALTPAPGSTTT